MAKIAEAFVEITARTDKFRRGVQGATGAAKRSALAMTAAFASVTAGITLMTAAIGKAVRVFAVQDRAERKLRGTLRAFGDDVKTTSKFLEDHASAIQSLTGIGDELTLNTFAQIRALGVQTRQIPQVARAAIGLATAFGISNQAAARYVALAQQGETTMLRRYIPAIRTAKDAQEAFNMVMDFGLRGFRATVEETESLSGALDKLKAGLGDIVEGVGSIFVTGGLANSLGNLGNGLAALGSALRASAPDIRTLIGNMFDFAFRLLDILLAKLKIGIAGIIDDMTVSLSTASIIGPIRKGILHGLAFGLRKQGTNQLGEGTSFAGGIGGTIGRIRDAFIQAILKSAGIKVPEASFAGAGGGGGTGGIIDSIQTAIGGFKTGQNPQLDAIRTLVDETEKQTRKLDEIADIAKEIGPDAA